MIIIGAKGFAKEVLEILYQLNQLDNVAFYDDVNADIPHLLYDKFTVIKSISNAQHYFNTIDNSFTIGIGNPILRKKLYEKFTSIGGKFVSTISPKATIGHFGNSINEGCNIMTGTIITNDITLEKGVLINLSCTIGHDSFIGEFAELSPGVNISGNCSIGSFSVIGTNATLLPKISIGHNVIVGAGSVVTKDIPDNSLVVGIPAVIKRQLEPLVF